MGTRSLTVFYDGDGTEVCVLYRHMDGNPVEFGADLKGALVGTQHNGIGCLAAQVIGKLKEGVGGLYVEPTDTRGMDEEYVYTVYLDQDVPFLKVQGAYINDAGLPVTEPSSMPVLYDGRAEDFDPAPVERGWLPKRTKAPGETP